MRSTQSRSSSRAAERAPVALEPTDQRLAAKLPDESVQETIAAVMRGEIVILDNSWRREGAFIMAAQKVTTEAVNFMTKHGRGLICLGLTDAHMERLALSLMAPEAAQSVSEEFTLSIDLLDPPSTGISARDRARCIRRAVAADARPEEFLKPGHVFPLRAHSAGVVGRPGYAEAAVSLAQLAGLLPAGVICHIMNPDGTMARTDDLMRMSEDHKLHLITIQDIIACELQLEQAPQPLTEANLLTSLGPFVAKCFDSVGGSEHHLALVQGRTQDWEDALAYIHSECLVGDVFGSLLCSCRAQLDEAMSLISAEGRGVIVYLREHEERCLELLYETRTSAGQERAQTHASRGRETHDFIAAARILTSLGIRSVRLLANDPAGRQALERYGVRVRECLNLGTSLPA